MKKTFMSICALLLAATMLSCSGADSSEDIFMFVGSEGIALSEGASGHASPQKYGLHTLSERVELADVSDSVVFPFDNNEYVYWNSECYPKSSDSDEYGEFYGVFDEYKSEDNRRSVQILHGTDLFVYYINLDAYEHNKKLPTDKYTDEEIRAIADDFLQSFVDKSKYEDYSFQVTRKDGVYDVYYTRYIHGHPTDDVIWITINTKGQIMGYNGRNFGKYEKLADSLSRSSLDKAKEKLISKVKSMNLDSLKINYTQVVTNRSGDVFMELGYTYSAGYVEAAEMILVAVK